VQSVLWVIELTKTVESICCAVHDTVTLPRAGWRTIRSPHSVWALIATTTDAGRHRPSAARPTTPTVRSVGVVYYALVPTRHFTYFLPYLLNSERQNWKWLRHRSNRSKCKTVSVPNVELFALPFWTPHFRLAEQLVTHKLGGRKPTHSGKSPTYSRHFV